MIGNTFAAKRSASAFTLATARSRTRSIAEHHPARLGSLQSVPRPLCDQAPLLFGKRRVEVQHEGIGIGAKLCHDKRHPVSHQARDEMNVTRQTVKLRDEHRALALARLGECCGELRATVQGIGALAAFHGWKRIRFHDTRHSHATHMLVNRVHPKLASERLGHSRVGITLDTYSHVIEGLQEEAVSMVDDAMAKALQNRAAKADR